MATTERVHPLRKPENHQPPVPRFQVIFDDEVTHVYTAYAGVQLHGAGSDAGDAFSAASKALIDTFGGGQDGKPDASERFVTIDGHDVPNAKILVCYWIDEANYKATLKKVDLEAIHKNLPAAGRDSVGLWLETFATPVSRLETNYSGLDYLPGLARLPKTTVKQHELTAYWGAARDRIPDAAHDLFEAKGGDEEPERIPDGLGQHLVGTNVENLVFIRTGQFWENCGAEEQDAYEKRLEPTLKTGLRFLWDNPDAGALGLRFIRNTLTAGGDDKLKETCVTGYFTSLDKLEAWAKGHKSHLAIYNGALRHAKTFGDARKFRTWHEVAVLKRGEANFEYVNCLPNTGVVRFVPLQRRG
jgi:hypothetical protein